MKSKTICIFAVILTSAIVAADLTAAKEKIIDSLIGEEAKNMDGECLNKLKIAMNAELEAAMEKYVDRIENGVPVFKRGIIFSLGRFIRGILLPTSTATVDDKCFQQTKEVFRNIVMAKYGKMKSMLKFA